MSDQGSIDPPRNFTIALEDRVRALAGPPAYMRRKRAIEDLEEKLVNNTLALLRAGRAPDEIEARTRRDLARRNDLVDRHNRYYPAEANLPIHPRTGRLLERGAPWKPLEGWTVETLVERAKERV